MLHVTDQVRASETVTTQEENVMFDLEIESSASAVGVNGVLDAVRTHYVTCESYEVRDEVLLCRAGRVSEIWCDQSSGTSEESFTLMIFPLTNVTVVRVK